MAMIEFIHLEYVISALSAQDEIQTYLDQFTDGSWRSSGWHYLLLRLHIENLAHLDSDGYWWGTTIVDGHWEWWTSNAEVGSWHSSE
jgi:hypothetical protein